MYDPKKREKISEIVELMKKNDWQAVLDIFQVRKLCNKKTTLKQY